MVVKGKGATELHKMYPEIPVGTIQNIKVGRQYTDVSDTVLGMDKVINSRTRAIKTNNPNLELPKKLDKEEYNQWRNAERRRLSAAGIHRDANMQTTPWPEFLPQIIQEKYYKNKLTSVS